MKRLEGKVAVVLGECGATVYVTGRTRRDGPPRDVPGTIEDTAEEVTRGGGHVIPVACDHRDPTQVEAFSPACAMSTSG
jgi:NAD(P)-dependent dehydrogenase (short-subunit alcohol dehydrogenase family)